MTSTDWLLQEDLTTEDRVTQSDSKPDANWTAIILAVLLGFFIIREVRDRGILPIPDDRTIVDVSGDFALIQVDSDSPDQVTSDQAKVLGWSGMISFAEEIGVELRKFDIDDDLSKTEPEFQVLADHAADPPSLTIAKDGKLTTGPVPGSVAEFKKQLEDRQ